MKKKGMLLVMIVMGITLFGCGIQEKKDPSSQSAASQSTVSQSDGENDSIPMWEIIEGKQEESSEDTVSLWEEDAYTSIILEDEEALYFCGEDHIRKIEKEGGRESYIWKNADFSEKGNQYAYSQTQGYIGGMLLNDSIYFIERWIEQENESAEKVKSALAMIKTDGSGYERIKEFSEGAVGQAVLLDGILYLIEKNDSGFMEGYPVDREGNLLTQKTVKTEPENLLSKYILPYYSQNGRRLLTPAESLKKLGYYLLRDENYALCKVGPQSGKKENLPESVRNCELGAVSNEYLCLISYEDKKIYLYENRTGNVRELGEFDGEFHIIFMDDEYLYYYQSIEEDSFFRNYFNRISLKDGKKEVLFDTDEILGMYASSLGAVMDVSLVNGFIYYPGAKEYKLYMMRRNVDAPETEEVLGSDLYDSGIGEIGDIKIYREKIYSEKNKDKIIAEVDLEWLVMDERFQGAAAINAVLEEQQQKAISYVHDYAKGQDALYLNEELEYAPTPFSFSSSVSNDYYRNGDYFSFVQQSAEYTGGFHEMPYWTGYTFHLQTGKHLALSDIVSDDEMRIKELVSRYFAKLYEKNTFGYWEDAVNRVLETTTLDSPFYLNEEGIVFYYGPYELASYAAGFQQIEIPYSEWNLKIELE